MFDWVVGVWLGFETLSSLLFQVYKLSRENTQPKNMCDIVFEKNKRSWWGSKQQSKGFFKKVLWEISQNSQEKIYAGISFLININSVDLQLH